MDKNKQTIFQYDPEADVLSWEITGWPIEYAKEIGNVVIHFSKNHSPVLIEILEATKLLTSALGILRKNGIVFPKPTPALSSNAQSIRVGHNFFTLFKRVSLRRFFYRRAIA